MRMTQARIQREIKKKKTWKGRSDEHKASEEQREEYIKMFIKS